jgi:hypothetical protein
MALTEKSIKELYEIASCMGIKNVKKYRKADLVDKILIFSRSDDMVDEYDTKNNTSPDTISEPIEAVNEPTPIIPTSIVKKAIQSIRNVFRFDHTRANVGDVFTKKMGDSKTRLTVLESNDKATTVVTNKGIRLKVLK